MEWLWIVWFACLIIKTTGLRYFFDLDVHVSYELPIRIRLDWDLKNYITVHILGQDMYGIVRWPDHLIINLTTGWGRFVFEILTFLSEL